MIIDAVEVRNFRSILHATLHCEKLTALVGANGVGKSTFLRALELFYDPSIRISPDDFHNDDTTAEISIAVSYTNLPPEAQQLFEKYTQDGRLTVERVITSEAGKTTSKYHGARLQCSSFQPIREGLGIKDRGRTAREAYERVRENPEFSDLPNWSTISGAADALVEWEVANPERCQRARDDGQFFGFSSVGQGYLGRFTRLLYIPAVRDASADGAESRGSVLSSLMDLVVRNALAQKPAVLRLQQRAQALYERNFDPTHSPELHNLGDSLSGTLTTYIPDAGVELRWLPLEPLALPVPKAEIKLIEDGYACQVDRAGHGLQRAFILSLLQHLTVIESTVQATVGTQRADEDEEEVTEVALPDLVLAIEEPELYQHPSRQRHFAQVLLNLATGRTPGVAERTQVLYSTHSPLFVGLDRINEIRRLRRVGDGSGESKSTKVIYTSLPAVANALWKADGEPSVAYTAATVAPRLKPILTPWMSEGFFADVAVLVEGEDDRAALLGTALALGIELESRGFSVIPCGGKTCLDRPAVVFNALDIPIYIVWDGDKGVSGANPADNHRLLRIMNHPVADWPSGVYESFACFEVDLERTLEAEIGPAVYTRLLAECQAEVGILKKKHAQKNPFVVAKLIERADREGCSCGTLVNIVQRVGALRG